MRFYPERWTKTYSHWMTNLRDWCISRQLWWGHRVPVWYRKAGNPDNAATAAPQIWCDVTPPPDAENWEQDPDVLDTWFSSWLWPFATMGWPEQTETLKKFYPTTDLVTGPDIIFFWVARMIMAGYEFMGDLPFRNVYFTGIIRDKLGRKMSKSLGNSPDPLELIAKYGADALRFGTMRSAPLGQDVLFDEKDVELGRNFCNKLWNACRFRQMQGGEVQGEIAPKLLTSYDKWILLKLDQAIREITTAFAEYRFNEATQTLYRFFWSEYCDWYVEASKAVRQMPIPERGTDAPPTEARRATHWRCWISFCRTRCGCSIHSCPSSPKSCGTAWVTARTCRRSRAAKRSCSPRGPNRSTRISALTTDSNDCHLQTVDSKYRAGDPGKKSAT